MTTKVDRLKKFQEAKQKVRAMVARLEAEYETYVISTTDGIVIFTDTDNLKGLGLVQVEEETTIKFQFVDITKRLVVKLNSRREFDDYLGSLSDADFVRYENQEAIVILVDEKPVKFYTSPIGFK